VQGLQNIHFLVKLLGFGELEELALQNYKSQLTPAIADTELLSDVARLHSSVRYMITDYIAANIKAVKAARH